MTRIIAVLLVLGQFEVAVETSKGYLVATFSDTESGVTQFLQAIRPALEAEPGRFYPCVAYDGPARDVLQSPLAERIGLVQNMRTGLRDPVSPTLRGSFATTESLRILRAAPRRSLT